MSVFQQGQLTTINGLEGRWHQAKKWHECDSYFTPENNCIGDGSIKPGQLYWSPNGITIGPYHPYRICPTCAITALAARRK